MRFAAFTTLLILLLDSAGCSRPVRVGSKAFSESAVLGELVFQLAEREGVKAEHREQLGGTGLVWSALQAGDIDIYPDYTGTIAKDILKDESLTDEDAIRAALAELDIEMTRPLGFENSYEIGMKEEVAQRLGIRSISDLKEHPDLVLGFGTEFVDREDGWRGLRARYSLPQTDIRSMEHALGYAALRTGDIQVMDIYATDAGVDKFGLRILEDDLDYFPKYEAVLVYRADLAERAPSLVEAVQVLEGKINHDEMLAMNVRVDVDESTPRKVANDFLTDKFAVRVEVYEPSLAARVASYTLQHLLLVVVSLGLAIPVAVPLGIIAAKRPAAGHAILSVAEIVQTIPGLALLILLMKPLEVVGLETIGKLPTIIALFLYSLLPIIRNTHAGIVAIPNSVRESATALGLTPWAQLWRIELPMASRLILAGIKTTAVINVGYATLGGLIGAGGYGQPILQGLYRNSVPKMLEGAIPAALLALCVKWVFELSERFVVPKGLRLKSAH